MLISGGVDSSVALKLLKDEGHDITAYYIKIWMEDKFSFLGKCPFEEDLGYVEKICDELEVPLEIINLQKAYWNRVVKTAIFEVKSGRTPNPDILCNSKVKFGVFYDAIDKKFERVATGHYAQVKEVDGKILLIKSPDPVKDQTYFLALLDKDQLSRAMFPIGKLKKESVRKLAQKFDLVNKDRKDSQGICFLGKIKYRDFLREHLGEKRGDIVNKETGEKMGTHDGYWYYTMGQRKDIKLSGGPWYVVQKDAKKNIIYIASKNVMQEEKRDSFIARGLHWISDPPTKKNLKVKVRHGEKDYNCKIKFIKDKLEVALAEADSGLAAGQYAVFYDKEVCLGGGVID